MPDGGYALSGLQGYQYVIIRRPDKRSAIRRRLGGAQRNATFGIRFHKQWNNSPNRFRDPFPG
ncbi:hypothetical protein E2051_16405 [Salmonella enterica subsp. enterica serovar Liverpool]|nr:hypothetical protein [Salmonella enterica]EBR9553840.1 hypothetical protein [Salmonella enterica subsp. enterica serovar Liverpool]ECD6543409.1 hypothetical protein [Salmonella enterica subsp. enterica serovar Liverpool]